MKTVYWTMKNGEKIDVDCMTLPHLRSTLKMLISNMGKYKEEIGEITGISSYDGGDFYKN